MQTVVKGDGVSIGRKSLTLTLLTKDQFSLYLGMPRRMHFIYAKKRCARLSDFTTAAPSVALQTTYSGGDGVTETAPCHDGELTFL